MVADQTVKRASDGTPVFVFQIQWSFADPGPAIVSADSDERKDFTLNFPTLQFSK